MYTKMNIKTEPLEVTTPCDFVDVKSDIENQTLAPNAVKIECQPTVNVNASVVKEEPIEIVKKELSASNSHTRASLESTEIHFNSPKKQSVYIKLETDQLEMIRDILKEEKVAKIYLERFVFPKQNFVCSDCWKIFEKPHSLKKHKTLHIRDSPFVCDLCNFKYPRSDIFKNHQCTTTVEKNVCNECDFICVKSGPFNSHKTVHSGFKPFRCDKCEYNCTESGSLIVHRKKHITKKPKPIFYCEQCNYKCSKAFQMKEHKRIHSGEKPFECDVCEYKCTQSGQLIKHKRLHTREMPYKCGVCNYKCANLSNLTRHKRIHTAEMFFKCEVCDYKCVQSSNLKRHQRTHSSDNFFKCNVCSFDCKKSATLKKHKLTHEYGVSVGGISPGVGQGADCSLETDL